MRFKSYSFLLVLVFFIGMLLWSCQMQKDEVAEIPSPDEVKEIIQGKLDRLSEIVEDQDEAELKKFIADTVKEDAAVSLPDRLVEGRQVILEHWMSRMEEITNLEYKIERVILYHVPNVEGYDCLALVIGRYSFKERKEGEELIDPPLAGGWLHRDDCSWWFAGGLL